MHTRAALPPAFVVSGDARRLAQFRAAWHSAGLPADAVEVWPACMIPECGLLGNAVSYYALVCYAIAAGLPSLLVFEDDAIPCDDCAAMLPAEIEAAQARGDSALRLGWIPLPSDSPPPPGRNVLGTQAWALLDDSALRDYRAAWPRCGKPEGVFLEMRGKVSCASRNLFAQYTPRDAETRAIHVARGWNADKRIAAIRASYQAAYSKAYAVAQARETEGAAK